LITLAPLGHSSFGIVAEWLSNPDINQWLTSDWRQRAIDPVVIGIAVRNKRNKFFLVQSEEIPCGLVALSDLDLTDEIALVWYVLGTHGLSGRGIMTEALRQLVELAFREFGIKALHAWIIEENLRSRRVLEKNGFREAGRLREAVFRNGHQMDRIYFDLTRSDVGF
jgi:RimJ/RimL family protein N-acetyltransferase